MRLSVATSLALLFAACSAGTSGTGTDRHDRRSVDAGRPRVTDAGGTTIETCNGVDDDGDGMVDEGCMCASGASQPCWPGEASRRGVGRCHDGTQTCVSGSEFAAWGACSGATLPSVEVPGNCDDEDCDGVAIGCTCAELETCDDSVDNDCNGLVDCDDPMCAGSAACAPHCEPSEVCGNGVDDDCDGAVDGADTDCCTCVPGATRFCDDPVYCNWGLATCGPDGHWGTCIETDARPPGCTDGVFGFDASYDPDCCFASGACCEASFGSPESHGNCAGITECLR